MPSAWPPLTQTAKPWTRWWWPGSAVERGQLSTQLRALAAAGVGGVEITPIYGARGFEDRYVEFLSPSWVSLLEHTTREAAGLGMGVDMATGTGWPFGGPEVSRAQGSSSITLVDGRLAGKPTEMKVKRAAPGGAGLVLDPYSSEALESYLQRFTRALSALPRGALHGQFHDSFEYYNAGWSSLLPAKFRSLNGYDLQSYAREFLGEKPLDADTLGRIKGDYRRTLAALHLDYVNTWVAWSHAQGFSARNQAHGAPGNLLDLYAAADIPETESFGMTPMPIAGMQTDPAMSSVDPDPPLNLIGRFASSAAHVMGRPLASSETLTWLRENFHETPAAAKPQLDRLFIAGINHVFYHGTAYSPADAPWPGWFFYAASQLNPNNPLWQDFGAMNAYVARVQSVLQAGKADNDILLYWPLDDLSDDAAGLMRQYGMHDNGWLVDSSTGREALALLQAGYSFDLISDAQLQRVEVDHGALVAPGGRYQVVLIPAARRMPVATLERLLALKRRGARVIFATLPADVPGFGTLEARRAELKALLAALELREPAGEVAARLERLGIRREAAAANGLAFIRRARGDGYDYFLVNLRAGTFDGWLPLATAAGSALIMDPLTGRTGAAALRRKAGTQVSAYLQLASGESVILRTQRGQSRESPAWPYVTRKTEGEALDGDWQLEFLAGGPEIPAPARMAKPAAWTTLADPATQSFSGTARYRLVFDAPKVQADDWLLDLGDVRESARVTLNGEQLGTAWSLPFRLRLGSALKPRANLLEIEVSNLPANRVRDLDLRKVDWKIMNDINLASLKYRALDASLWEVAPSGLAGPVRLVPLKLVSPR
jgi:hypothetical protein